MSLMDRCKIETIDLRTEYPISMPFFRKTSSVRHTAFERGKLYELSITAACRQPIIGEYIEQAKEHAGAMITRFIYKDALSHFETMKMAYFSGDAQLFESAMRDLQRELTGT